MAKPIAKETWKIYRKLWNTFKDEQFTYAQAYPLFRKEKKHIAFSVVLNELKKSGWLVTKQSKEDIRKRIYRLKSPTKIVEE